MLGVKETGEKALGPAHRHEAGDCRFRHGQAGLDFQHTQMAKTATKSLPSLSRSLRHHFPAVKAEGLGVLLPVAAQAELVMASAKRSCLSSARRSGIGQIVVEVAAQHIGPELRGAFVVAPILLDGGVDELA